MYFWILPERSRASLRVGYRQKRKERAKATGDSYTAKYTVARLQTMTRGTHRVRRPDCLPQTRRVLLVHRDHRRSCCRRRILHRRRSLRHLRRRIRPVLLVRRGLRPE